MFVDNIENGEYIELRFGPHWNYIAAARQFIQNFLAISIGDQEKADKVAISASELLENAVKYSTDSQPYMLVHVSQERQVTVIVRNQASPDAIKSLQEIFEKVNQGNPLDAYVSQMREAATREDGKSQLGLVRIRYEAGAKLSLDILDDNQVSITIKMN